MLMQGPEATMRGPGKYPSFTRSRRSAAANGGEPTSRTVVNPASRVRRACTTATIEACGSDVLNCQMSSKWSAREVRSEEHTSELQSRFDLVCRLLLEIK